MLSGTLFETAPLQGDDFRSLLPLLPGVVRDGNGRLRIRGGQPTTGALQVSSASLIDPSTGDFDLDLPAQSVESVEVLANPFAAEYGRFTTSITQIRTRSGTNEWDVSFGNLVPRFRSCSAGSAGSSRAFRCAVRSEGPRLLRPGPAVPLRRHAGQEPAGRTGSRPPQPRFVHADRQRPVAAAPAQRRPDRVPARAATRDDEHLPSGGDDTRHEPEGAVGRHRRPLRDLDEPRGRNDAVDAQVRGRRQHREPGADGLRAADAERRIFQRSGSPRQQLPVGRGVQPVAGPLARRARLQVRHRPAAFGVRRREHQPSG